MSSTGTGDVRSDQMAARPWAHRSYRPLRSDPGARRCPAPKATSEPTVQVLCGACVWRVSLSDDKTCHVDSATPIKHMRGIAMNTGLENTAATQQTTCGSLDGVGASDHDVPFRFGRLPSSNAPFPFTPLQYGRLLVLRGRVRDALAAEGEPATL
jgi:hypothetical protein